MEGDRDMETVLKPEQKSLKEQLLKAFKAYDVDAGGVRRRLPAGLASPYLSLPAACPAAPHLFIAPRATTG